MARSGCSFSYSAILVTVFNESDSPLIASRMADSLSCTFVVSVTCAVVSSFVTLDAWASRTSFNFWSAAAK